MMELVAKCLSIFVVRRISQLQRDEGIQDICDKCCNHDRHDPECCPCHGGPVAENKKQNKQNSEDRECHGAFANIASVHGRLLIDRMMTTASQSFGSCHAQILQSRFGKHI